MKRNKIIVPILFMSFMLVSDGFAQGRSQEAKKNKFNKGLGQAKEKLKGSGKDIHDKVTEELNEARKKIKEEKEINGKSLGRNKENGGGNAFGKNKKDLSGKAFGQERARQAKLNLEEKKKTLNNLLTVNQRKVNEAKTRVKEKKEKLKSDKRAGKITNKQFEDEMNKIDKVEEGIADLESKLAKAQKMD